MKNKTRILEVEEDGRQMRIFQKRKSFLFFSWWSTQPIPQERILKVLYKSWVKLKEEVNPGFLFEGDISKVAIDHIHMRIDKVFLNIIQGIKEGKL